ncbi:MAG: hypothetical protein ABIJ86_02460 [Spirochaetota bacterium]
MKDRRFRLLALAWGIKPSQVRAMAKAAMPVELISRINAIRTETAKTAKADAAKLISAELGAKIKAIKEAAKAQSKADAEMILEQHMRSWLGNQTLSQPAAATADPGMSQDPPAATAGQE